MLKLVKTFGAAGMESMHFACNKDKILGGQAKGYGLNIFAP